MSDIDAAARIRESARNAFGERAPDVEVVPGLASRAVAGVHRVRLREGVEFGRREVEGLVHHELYIHVATSLNGADQVDLPILAGGHPGTTRTQEGLAVFGELLAGAMTPTRMRRLADRSIAIDMSIRGGDFLEVYRFFLERTDGDRDEAFENARRVFRGGVLTGGAPFTKDDVYLDGLLRIYQFLRAAIQAGRSDCLQLLLCGKLDLEDLPALSLLAEAGLCRFPTFLPPWVADPRFVVSYMAFSTFLGHIDPRRAHEHYREMLDACPICT